jgi:hypothetical protein
MKVVDGCVDLPLFGEDARAFHRIMYGSETEDYAGGDISLSIVMTVTRYLGSFTTSAATGSSVRSAKGRCWVVGA